MSLTPFWCCYCYFEHISRCIVGSCRLAAAMLLLKIFTKDLEKYVTRAPRKLSLPIAIGCVT